LDVSTGEEICRFELTVFGFHPLFDIVFGSEDRSFLAADMVSLVIWIMENGDFMRWYSRLLSLP